MKLCLALLLLPSLARAQTTPLVERGREVYIAEGCIHCHSQYVRPATADLELYGPSAPLDQTLRASPPLLGNRRQGPDLTNVALRRTTDWNRLHLINPRTVSPGSRMPAYAHLFSENDPRGPALLAYLDTLKPASPTPAP